MLENVSFLYKALNSTVSGEPVVEQLFPPTDSEEAKITGNAASQILKTAGRVKVLQTRTRYEQQVEAKKVTSYGDERLIVRTDSGEQFSLDGWDINNDERPAEQLVGEIEANVGLKGLTIVIERGIYEARQQVD